MAFLESGAENEIRTRDPDLGKVVLYQLSYSRKQGGEFYACASPCQQLKTLFIDYSLSSLNDFAVELR